jgi:hypothetical protein
MKPDHRVTNQHMKPTATILLYRMFCYRGTARRRAAGNVAARRLLTPVLGPVEPHIQNSLYESRALYGAI